MGKKKLRAKYTSKHQRSSMDWSLTKAIRLEKSGLDREIHKLDALSRGKNVFTTIPNPNPENTKERYIRVPLKQVSLSVRKAEDRKESTA